MELPRSSFSVLRWLRQLHKMSSGLQEIGERIEVQFPRPGGSHHLGAHRSTMIVLCIARRRHFI